MNKKKINTTNKKGTELKSYHLNEVISEKKTFPHELIKFKFSNCARFSTSQLLRKDMLIAYVKKTLLVMLSVF